MNLENLESESVTLAWPPLSADSEYFWGWDRMSLEDQKAASEARKKDYLQKQKDLAAQGIKSQKELNHWISLHFDDDTTKASPYMEPYGGYNLLNLLRVEQAITAVRVAYNQVYF